MHKTIIVTNKGPVHQVMFSDVKDVENVIYIDEKVSFTNKCKKILNKIHESRKVNRIVKLPFRSIWEGSYNLTNAINDDQIVYKVLFTDVTITDYPI